MMRMVFSLFLAVLFLTGVGFASEVEGPPSLILDDDGIAEVPVTGSYSWSSPAGNPDEWTSVEACGMAPTDPAVLNASDHVLLTEDRTYAIVWKGTPPDELTVFSWKADAFLDQEHVDDYQENPEIILRPAEGKITLKPDRVYDFQAIWRQSGEDPKPYGKADYYLVTEQLIMLDGPGMVMMGGWTPSADPAVTDDLKAVFEKGVSTLTGASAVPVAWLGSQVVAGTNYAFLCQIQSAYPDTEAEPAYAIVYLYQDLQGNVSILNIADFDIGGLCTYGE